ncbi:MAG: flagellar basal body-associated FliL family protein [Natronohydrobacter sp.]|nr:flagellar basal body-associated FliL family protein [Natronohydrobacter sp.]
MRKLIPIFLILLGLGIGTGAGLYLRPAPEIAEDAQDSPPAPVLAAGDSLGTLEFANQFMVPLVVEGRIAAMVVLKLALEIPESQRDMVTASIPRLRDGLLQVLFDHANSGGFEGMFTDHGKMVPLRRSLLEAAQQMLGREAVVGVLITDMLRTGAS